MFKFEWGKQQQNQDVNWTNLDDDDLPVERLLRLLQLERFILFV